MSGEVVRKFENAGVKKIVCTVKEEDHFINIQVKQIYNFTVMFFDRR